VERKIGVNVISLLPWSIRNLNSSLGLAATVGFSGVQLLPLENMSRTNLDQIPRHFVISYEGAWNSGTFSGVAKRLLGISGEEDPTLKDWLIFGKKPLAKARLELIKTKFPDALPVIHSAGRGILEMHPELRLRDIDYIKNDVSVVWDTEHVVRVGRHGEKPLTTDWRRFLGILDHKNIKLIHYKPDLPGLLPTSETGEMLLRLAELTTCPVVLEARPPNSHFTDREIFGKIDWLQGHFGFLESIFS
jgi:hypothetical protein